MKSETFENSPERIPPSPFLGFAGSGRTRGSLSYRRCSGSVETAV